MIATSEPESPLAEGVHLLVVDDLHYCVLVDYVFAVSSLLVGVRINEALHGDFSRLIHDHLHFLVVHFGTINS